MIINTVVSSAWQKRRSDFNHDWLKNSYCTGELERWDGFFRGAVEGNEFTLERFESRVIDEWIKRAPEVLNLAKKYEVVMSPAALFEESMLSNMGSDTKKWVRPLIVALWKHKHGVDEKIALIINAYKHSNSALEKLRAAICILDTPGKEADTNLFTNLFQTFHKRCRELGEAIQCLESSIKIT